MQVPNVEEILATAEIYIATLEKGVRELTKINEELNNEITRLVKELNLAKAPPPVNIKPSWPKR